MRTASAVQPLVTLAALIAWEGNERGGAGGVGKRSRMMKRSVVKK